MLIPRINKGAFHNFNVLEDCVVTSFIKPSGSVLSPLCGRTDLQCLSVARKRRTWEGHA